jgi:hypothetical protein
MSERICARPCLSVCSGSLLLRIDADLDDGLRLCLLATSSNSRTVSYSSLNRISFYSFPFLLQFWLYTKTVGDGVTLIDWRKKRDDNCDFGNLFMSFNDEDEGLVMEDCGGFCGELKWIVVVEWLLGWWKFVRGGCYGGGSWLEVVEEEKKG